jgi:hypothetical protein
MERNMKSYTVTVEFQVQVDDKIDAAAKTTFIALNLATVKLQDWSGLQGPKDIDSAKFTEYQTVSIEQNL